MAGKLGFEVSSLFSGHTPTTMPTVHCEELTGLQLGRRDWAGEPDQQNSGMKKRRVRESQQETQGSKTCRKTGKVTGHVAIRRYKDMQRILDRKDRCLFHMLFSCQCQEFKFAKQVQAHSEIRTKFLATQILNQKDTTQGQKIKILIYVKCTFCKQPYGMSKNTNICF